MLSSPEDSPSRSAAASGGRPLNSAWGRPSLPAAPGVPEPPGGLLVARTLQQRKGSWRLASVAAARGGPRTVTHLLRIKSSAFLRFSMSSSVRRRTGGVVMSLGLTRSTNLGVMALCGDTMSSRS